LERFKLTTTSGVYFFYGYGYNISSIDEGDEETAVDDHAKSRAALLQELTRLRHEFAEREVSEQRALRTAEVTQAACVYAESIVDTVREPLVVLDNDLRVVSANRAFYTTFHVTPTAIKQRFIYELGNGQWDIPALHELLESILPEHTAFEDFNVEHTFEHIGPRTMLLNARQLVEPVEAATRILLAMEDITERKRMEDELLKAEKIASLGMLAGGIAHNFNNLLTGIMGNISLAKMIAGPDKKVVARLTEAEKACQRATALTHQLLTFSPGGAPVRRTASITELLRASTDFALSGANVRSDLALSADLWPIDMAVAQRCPSNAGWREGSGAGRKYPDTRGRCTASSGGTICQDFRDRPGAWYFCRRAPRHL
jgi:PAS domain-containing protein